jgi:hypothetical protein
VFIALKLRAFRATTVTGFRASGADEVGEQALPGRDASSRHAMIGTIQTGPQGGVVLFFPLFKHVPAMRRTGITSTLTIATGLGAMLKGMGMMIVVGGRGVSGNCRGKRQGGR